MVAGNTDFRTTVDLPENSPSSFIRLIKWLLKHAWFVYKSDHIHTTLSPSQTYKVLETAAKPSVKRLGLRKLFANSRRYFIRAKTDGGFQMMTSSRVWWHPKRRTNATAILSANFEAIGDTTHRIHLNSRVRVRYLFGQFLWPAFMTSIIIFLNWNPWILIGCIFALFALSWTAHRLTALLEIHEIEYFIETVLHDFSPETPQQLAAGDADIVMEDEFTAEWDRYIEEKRAE